MKASILPAYVWAPMLILLILFGSFPQQTESAQTEIAVFAQSGQERQLIVYSVGAPAFPFGPGKVRFVLIKDGNVTGELDCILFNDGKQPDADNFAVRWEADSVWVTVSAEEQEDATYILYFDGRSAAKP